METLEAVAIPAVEATSLSETKGWGLGPPYSRIKKCKNVKIDQLNLNHYDKERDIEVHRTDDCQYRYCDCNSPRCHELHGILVKNSPSGFKAKPGGFFFLYKLC